MRLIDATELEKRIQEEGINQAEQSPQGKHDIGVMAYANCLDMVKKSRTINIENAHWFIDEYEYFTCSKCGNSYYTGAKSREQAQKLLKAELFYDFCPYCGVNMKERYLK